MCQNDRFFFVSLTAGFTKPTTMEPSIFERIEKAQPVDFGDIISKSFDLFKKVWTEALLHALVSLVVVIPFIIIVYVPIIPIYLRMLRGAYYDPYYYDPYYGPSFADGFSIAMIFIWMFFIFVMVFLMQPFIISITGHFLKVCKQYDLEEEPVKEGYFSIVKKHFWKLLLLSMAMVGIAFLATLLCYFPIIYVMVPLQLILPVFVFNDTLSVSETIKACFKLGNKYWFMVFGLMLVSGLISMLGMIFCFIGIIVTSYFQYIVLYYFYKDSVGFEKQSDSLLVLE